MHFLQLEIGDSLMLSWYYGDIPNVDSTSSNVSRCYPGVDSLIFYDWLDDQTGNLCGLEIHIDKSHPFTPILSQKSYISCADFPRVFFKDVVICRPRSLEAFGDIYLVTSDNHQSSIFVGVEEWLMNQDRAYLTSFVNGSNEIVQ